MQPRGDATHGDGDVTVVPPLEADPIFVESVDEAIVGDPTADSPEAQPERHVTPIDFPSLFIRHRSALSLHARRFLNDAHDVEDVVQETFLRLFLAIPEIETELQALAFARRVLTNLCIDRYRAAKRRPSVINLDTGASEWLLDDTDVTDPVVQAEDAAVVRQALALLSPLHRAALVKREIEEKPLPVIAAELGISDDSVKHLLYRARRALRRLLVGTTVDPAAELTIPEVIRLANQRCGEALVKSGHYVIVFLFVLTAGVFAGRLQLNHDSGPDGTVPAIGSGSEGQPTAPGPAAVGGGHHADGHSGSGHAHAGHAGTTASSAAPGPSSTKTQHDGQPGAGHHGGHTTPLPTNPPSHGGRGGSTPPPAPEQPKLFFGGDLTVVQGGVPAIDSPTAQSTPAGQQVSGQFVAPTDEGAFVMQQTFTRPTDGPSSLAMNVSLPVDGQAVQTTPLTMSTGATPLANHNVLAVGSLDVVPATPAALGATQPAVASDGPTHVAVSMVVNLHASQVVEESVTVTNPPTGAPAAGAPASGPGSTPPAASLPDADASVSGRRS